MSGLLEAPGPVSTPRSSPTSSDPYAVDPDLGHADLGAPTSTAGPMPAGGAAIADAWKPSGGAPRAGSAPLTPELGGGSSGAASRAGANTWRSEARALASRTRALSRELGRLDRSEGAASSNTASETGRTSGTAASRSGPETSSGPGTPDAPPQVPLGGTEWLAAAGAAYALKRLRNKNGTEEESEDEA